MGMETGLATVEITKTTVDPATPLLGTLLKDACTPMFINVHNSLDIEPA